MTRFIDYKKYPLPRIRHHANAALYLPLNQHKGKKFVYPQLIENISWQNVFSSGKLPVYLDIGAGLGKFLIGFSLQNKNANTLGFELRRGAVDWINKVITSEAIGNAKVLWYSAVNGFPFIKSSSIEKIFYLFPDPWVKKRHYKRRAFSVGLLDEILRMLKPQGMLYLMTDVPEVDEYQQEILGEHNGFSFSYVTGDEWDLPVKTNQEEFCIKKGIPFIRMVCKPRPTIR